MFVLLAEEVFSVKERFEASARIKSLIASHDPMVELSREFSNLKPILFRSLTFSDHDHVRIRNYYMSLEKVFSRLSNEHEIRFPRLLEK